MINFMEHKVFEDLLCARLSVQRGETFLDKNQQSLSPFGAFILMEEIGINQIVIQINAKLQL